MIYGYVRFPTETQAITGQLAQLKAAGGEKVFREKLIGAATDGPQFHEVMSPLSHGDVAVTSAVDHLSRDTTDLLMIACELQLAGAGIRLLAEPFLDAITDFAEIVFAILGGAATLEHHRILERTTRGRVDAKVKGVKFERKPKRKRHHEHEAQNRLAAGETQRSAACS